MTDDRPDPDELLARLKQEEAQAKRGKLKIFFGASAGVGKTYAMLSAARVLRAQGLDVVVGVVETHGRAETEALLPDLEVLPRKAIAYRERTLHEFDLDGALARKPALILVDELAHSNLPGSRHPKRWQDVDELLDAGIDVWSTINVQHLETLNADRRRRRARPCEDLRRRPRTRFAQEPRGRDLPMFERGRREGATPGVGLGLAICRAIVEAHGGRISGETRAGGGARFTVDLPRGEPPTVEAIEGEAAPGVQA